MSTMNVYRKCHRDRDSNRVAFAASRGSIAQAVGRAFQLHVIAGRDQRGVRGVAVLEDVPDGSTARADR